jgi:hypothetical protein
MNSLKLVCVSGLSKGDEFALADGVHALGRGHEAALRVLDMQCSRHHCEVCVKGDFVSIEDLKSRHGTMVNGAAITDRCVLKRGDRVTVGTTVLILCERHTALRDLTAAHPNAVAGIEVEEFRTISERLVGAGSPVLSPGHQHHHRRCRFLRKIARRIGKWFHWPGASQWFGKPSPRPG